MRDFYAFLHVCSLKRYKEIFKEMWEKSLPLVKDSKKTYIGVVGPGRLDEQNFPENVEVVYFNEDPTTKELPSEEQFWQRSFAGDYLAHEFPTLNLLRKICKEHDCYVCYYHLRGVTSPPDNMPINQQRDYMTHFNIERYKECFFLLEYGFDAVGVELENEPAVHFSGNFWWSKSEHVNTLVEIENLPAIPNFYDDSDKKHRHRCEMWICSNPKSYYFGMWHSQIHPSMRNLIYYEKEKYYGKKLWDVNEENDLFIKNDSNNMKILNGNYN